MRRGYIKYYLLLIIVLFTYNNCAPSFEASGSFSAFDLSSIIANRPYEAGPMVQSSFRKLTNNELENKIKNIFELDFNVLSYLGEEPLTPFNNTIKDQLIDENLINNIEYFSRELAAAILRNQNSKRIVMQCQASGPSDTGCLSHIITKLFEKTFATPPPASTLTRLKNDLIKISQDSNNFEQAIESLLMFTFQSPRFIYSDLGGGNINSGIYTLSELEYANKLAFLITGSSADSQLIELALNGSLKNDSLLEFEINRLFKKAEASRQMVNFHSQWFGFYQSQLPPSIAVNAILETEYVLKNHILDQDRNWLDLLQLDYTYVNDTLATHYGFPTKGTNEFYKFDYANTNQPRKGIFSHATWLSAFPKIGDSSPSKRGYQIIKSLLCDTIDQPPDDVDLDVLPEPTNGGDCKEDSHIALKTTPACMGCHIKMDNIGLGLENFNHLGQYRTHELKNKSCEISGEGEVFNIGKFNGLNGFSDVLYRNRTTLQNCLVEKMGTFAFGFNTKDVHPGYLRSLQHQFREHGSYKKLVRDIIMSDEFKNIIWK